jgi:hypothetical protein
MVGKGCGRPDRRPGHQRLRSRRPETRPLAARGRCVGVIKGVHHQRLHCTCEHCSQRCLVTLDQVQLGKRLFTISQNQQVATVSSPKAPPTPLRVGATPGTSHARRAPFSTDHPVLGTSACRLRASYTQRPFRGKVAALKRRQQHLCAASRAAEVIHSIVALISPARRSVIHSPHSSLSSRSQCGVRMHRTRQQQQRHQTVGPPATRSRRHSAHASTPPPLAHAPAQHVTS